MNIKFTLITLTETLIQTLLKSVLKHAGLMVLADGFSLLLLEQF